MLLRLYARDVFGFSLGDYLDVLQVSDTESHNIRDLNGELDVGYARWHQTRLHVVSREVLRLQSERPASRRRIHEIGKIVGMCVVVPVLGGQSGPRARRRSLGKYQRNCD